MKWFSGILTVGTFAVLYLFEKRQPLRKQIEQKEISTARDLAIAAGAGAVVTIIEKPVTDRLTRFVEEKRFGLVKVFRLPKFVETALAVILLDYTLYIWHVLTHKLPFLWRFHQIHHADLDLTAATAVRFHFGEMTISVLFRAGQVLLIGVSPAALQTWQSLLFLSILFHHSNVRLPKSFEEKLGENYRHAAAARHSSFNRKRRNGCKLVERFVGLGLSARNFSPRRAAK